MPNLLELAKELLEGRLVRLAYSTTINYPSLAHAVSAGLHIGYKFLRAWLITPSNLNNQDSNKTCLQNKDITISTFFNTGESIKSKIKRPLKCSPLVIISPNRSTAFILYIVPCLNFNSAVSSTYYTLYLHEPEHQDGRCMEFGSL